MKTYESQIEFEETCRRIKSGEYTSIGIAAIRQDGNAETLHYNDSIALLGAIKLLESQVLAELSKNRVE